MIVDLSRDFAAKRQIDSYLCRRGVPAALQRDLRRRALTHWARGGISLLALLRWLEREITPPPSAA